ncbi:Glycosyl transferases group 1 [compost metagenome]
MNQSEEKTSSVELKERLESHYNSLNLSVEVRRHPNYSEKGKKKTRLQKLLEKVQNRMAELRYQDALINNKQALPEKFEKLIKEQLATGNYDLAWFNYMKMMPSSLPKSRTRIIVDMHDMQSARIKADVLPTLPKLRRAKYLKVFTNSEIRSLNKCDLAISISPVETKAIEETYKPKAKVVTLKATDDPRFGYSRKRVHDISFIGSNSAPNVDGLVWFIEQVLPIIGEALPRTRFLIQGNVTRGKIVKGAIANSPYRQMIKQQGFVESLASVYGESKVMVCPIRYGTGMKIKVVEAMAYGKAMVGTSIAFEGIDTSEGLICQDEANAFAESVIELIKNEDSRRAAEKAAALTFANQHSYKSLIESIRNDVLAAAEVS